VATRLASRSGATPRVAKCPHFTINCRVVHTSLGSYEGVIWEPTF
jgi:hypothetical protein